MTDEKIIEAMTGLNYVDEICFVNIQGNPMK
jgi:hypothetical protein